jgi:gamma-glutamylcyclotransferase (GGCT)/AIG2-like uncharacterized protein YtfP
MNPRKKSRHNNPTSEEIGPPAEARLPVFVYGTLRPGEKNYPLFLAGKTRDETPATTEGQLFFVRDGGYPYVLPFSGRVVGALVDLLPSVYDQTLNQLDLLEEYDPRNEAASLYLRRPCIVTAAEGSRRTAWIYFWNGPERAGEKIESGDFQDRPG